MITLPRLWRRRASFPAPMPIHHAGLEIRITTDKGTLVHTDCEHARISALYGGDDFNPGPWSSDGWSTWFGTADVGGGWLAFQVRARPGFLTSHLEDDHE